MRLQYDWAEFNLGDIANISTGKSNMIDAVSNGKYAFFDRSKNIKRSNRYLFNCEAIIIPGEGKDFIPRYFIGPFDLHQRAYAITGFSNIDGKFLYYLLYQQRGYFTQVATGATVMSLRKGMFTNFNFRAPTIQIQNKIAAILSAYDDLIENNLRRIKILEEMAHNLYREWFVDFRFPGHENTRFVDSPLGEIPEGWEVKCLGDVTENFDKLRKPLSSMIRAKRNGIYPYYGAAKIIDYIDDYIFDGTYLLIAEDGSVITNEQKPVLQYVEGKFWANNHVHILKGKGIVSTEHLYLALSEVNISGYITGAAQPKISQANLNRIPFLVPKESFIKLFNVIIIDIFKQSMLLNNINQVLRQTRDLLLPKLISGEVDVSGLDINLPEEAMP